MIRALSIVALSALTGCASSSDYKQYLAAQSDAHRLAIETQKPLVRLTAHAGQQISGLASLEVYMPASAPVVQQARPNEWAAVIGQGLSIAGTVGGLYLGGRASADLARAVGASSTAGYQFVQAAAASVTTTTNTNTSTVGANSGANSGNTATTTTTSTATNTAATNTNTSSNTIGANSGSNSGNSGRIAAGDISDSTHTPTVVTQPAPTVVTQPAPIIVTQPAPVIVPAAAP